jgi:hypothetical protein
MAVLKRIERQKPPHSTATANRTAEGTCTLKPQQHRDGTAQHRNRTAQHRDREHHRGVCLRTETATAQHRDHSPLDLPNLGRMRS